MILFFPRKIKRIDTIPFPPNSCLLDKYKDRKKKRLIRNSSRTNLKKLITLTKLVLRLVKEVNKHFN